MPNKKTHKKLTISLSSLSSFHILCVIVAISIILTTVKILMQPSKSSSMIMPAVVEKRTAFDFANQKITLEDGETIPFVNGSFTNTDPNGGQRTVTIVDPNVNAAGTNAAAIIVDDSAGSGTFYYLVGAMLKNGKEVYSKPVFLGDRIKIVSVDLDNPGAQDNGLVTVQYLDRAAKAPMAAMPSINTTKKFAFEDNGNLIGVLH